MSLTRELVRQIRHKPVGYDERRQASLFVLDTLACALGALKTEPARILGIVAPPRQGDMTRRAFYLGGLAHILELDDLHRSSVTHPGAVVVPAAWAVAEALDLGGRAFLDAVLAGYEASTRIGNAVGKAHYKVWHSTSTCGPFGSAMAAAQLLGLDEEQCVSALGNAGTQACGLWEFLASGAMSKHLHTARAAEAGVLAALLAREGFTGPDAILEGEKGFFKGLCPDPAPDAVLAEPTAPWQLTLSSIKPWPCCRHTHPTIDAAIALHNQLGGRKIARVEVATYRAALDVCDRPDPQDPYSAKFSLQHCVGMALRDGRVVQASFGEEGRRAAADLRPRVTLQVSREIDQAYPRAWGAAVRVETADGERLEAKRADCKGDPENPVDESELAAKAQALMEDGGMDEAAARTLIEKIGSLVEDRPVRSLGLFAEPTARPVGVARRA